MNESYIAYCGVDCRPCSDFVSHKCPGCRQTEWKEDNICMPVSCCLRQNISACGECPSFPCADMQEFYQETVSHQEAYHHMCAVHQKTCADAPKSNDTEVGHGRDQDH